MEYIDEFLEKNEKHKINPADPSTYKKFVDQLPIPEIAVPDDLSVHFCEHKKLRDNYYSIVMKETKHKFHRDFPFTKVWGYNGTCPGPTIEAYKDTTVNVEWINKLPSEHILPLDYTLHDCADTLNVRTVVHLHGARVKDDSDGHPDAWYTSNYETCGSKFTRKVYEYTNHQPGALLWYHDHAVGITRLNVYAGLAGFYIIRDKLEERLNLPNGDYEIPIMIQDKSFNEDGSLFYPDNATPPVEYPKPSTPSFFFGNTIAVNGKLWPYLKVEPRKYRFRILNASNLRGYDLKLSEGTFCQIGTDLGLLHHPVEVEKITMEPAERIDVVIDFSKYEGQEITLLNVGGTPQADENTGVIMKFKVTLPLKDTDDSTVPENLFPYHSINTSLCSKERTMHLDSGTDHFGRTMHLLNNKMWHDPATEIVELDTVEIWHIANHFQFPHPIHIHLINFEILGRKPFTDADFDENGNYIYDPNSLTPPEEFEKGLKDVVRTNPGEVTTIAMHFKGYTGDYVWHCHILEHEDHDMMRPLKVIDKK